MSDDPAESVADRAGAFLSLHRPGDPLIMANPWDLGSAVLLEHLGFAALATTSSGHAGTFGQPDGTVTPDEALDHAAALAAAVDVPVSADLENGFADDPDDVADTVHRAALTGIAGCSIEDWSGPDSDHLYPLDLAVARIAAAAEAAHDGDRRLVLTARAEKRSGGDDLAEVIERLTAFAEVGADVVYAPELHALDDIAAVVSAVDAPLNVLLRPAGPTVAQLADAGVARVSVGGAFARLALGAVAEASEELLGPGTLGFMDLAARGRLVAKAAFDDR